MTIFKEIKQIAMLNDKLSKLVELIDTKYGDIGEGVKLR